MQEVSVFNLLDLLVKMSNTDSNAETLTAELEDLTAELEQKQNELDELKFSITDDKYFDASGEIVDRNIEISTSKKIKNIEHEIIEQRSLLAELEEQSQKLDEEIAELNAKITNFRAYLDVVELRKNTSQDSQTVEMYTQIGTEETEYLSGLEADLTIKIGKLDSLNADIFSTKENIELNEQRVSSEKANLEEIRNNLATKSVYINNALKEKDEQEVNSLTDQIAIIQEKITTIKNNPAYLVNKIKDMIANNDTLAIDSELNHLIVEIEKIPYMNVNGDTQLEEFLEEVTKKRDDFKTYIENKRYDGIDTPIIEERINHLEESKIYNSKKIDKLKIQLTDIDTTLIPKVNNKIAQAEEVRQTIMKEIANYESSESNPKGHKKASVQASLNRKNSELKITNEIINAYLKEQRILIERANNIETVEIEELTNQIHDYETEINDLNKLLILKNKSKDVIEIEKDQEELQKLTTDIDLIKYRGEFKTTPRKIIADIRKMLNLDYTYHTNTLEETDENTDYQNMLETPEFSAEKVNIPVVGASENPEKNENKLFKVINIMPYEDIQTLDIEGVTDDIFTQEPADIQKTANEENLLWD